MKPNAFLQRNAHPCTRLISLLLLLSLLLSAAVLPSCNENENPDGGEESTSDTPPDDLTSEITYPSEAVDILQLNGGYNGGLRVKSSGELLFSPFSDQLHGFISAEGIDEHTDLYAMMTFILRDEEGKEYFQYDPFKLTFAESKGSFFDLWLQSSEIDCGFCPTAGRTYDIEMAVYTAVDTDNYSKDELLFVGTLNGVVADAAYADSAYYRPTAIPAPEERKGSYTITYAATEGGYLQGTAVQTVELGSKGTSKIMAVAEEGYVFMNWSDGEASALREGDTSIRNKTITAVFMKLTMTEGVPAMMITTSTGSPITSKSSYITASMRILGSDDWDVENLSLQIRGRGNSSWSGGADPDTYDSKNSYRLKLDEKEQLLGIGEGKNRDWVLNSNKFDVSSLRNYAVWQLADKLGTLPFVPQCSWVQLYINGDYRGLYMVTELVEDAGHRVEIETEGGDNLGFLVELDMRGTEEGERNLDYFYIDGYERGTKEWVVKNSGEHSLEETARIQAYLQKCHDTILGGDQAAIEALIDISSFVDMLILEEFSKDVDVNNCSMFFQKSAGGKLFATAPWDYDFGFGTYGDACNIDGLITETGSANLWFKALMSYSWFKTLVVNRVAEIEQKGYLQSVVDAVKKQGDILTEASDLNDERWWVYERNYHPYVSRQVSSDLTNYEEHIEFLTTWMEERFTLMKKAFRNYRGE